LEPDEWVMTPTSEMGLLLERRSSEAVARYEREMAVAIKQQVLAAAIGREIRGDPGVEHWSFNGSPPCGAHIQALQATCRAQNRRDSEWLEIASREIKLAEGRFKEALRSAERRSEYERGHARPSFETRGGPSGDRSQVGVAYLKGTSLAAARDRVTVRLFGLSGDSDEEVDDGDPVDDNNTEG